jgi:glycosyltransferase involved in cell wall biosynthesis
MKISAVIITYNEEHNIARCLESIKEVADEIVVVDSFSKDQTAEICRNYDVHFLEHPFDGHIEQKNYAMKQAVHDFVLSLDADEALSEELKASLMEIRKSHNADYWSMNRLTNYCGKWVRHCGWYPDTKIRLWNRKKGNWGGVNPHDQVIMKKGARGARLEGDILHYSFNSIDEHMQQINKFTDISARALKNKSRSYALLKMIFSPMIRFIRDYFFKLGILDGFYGFVICKNTSYSRFLRYAKLYDLKRKQNKKGAVH